MLWESINENVLLFLDFILICKDDVICVDQQISSTILSTNGFK